MLHNALMLGKSYNAEYNTGIIRWTLADSEMTKTSKDS